MDRRDKKKRRRQNRKANKSRDIRCDVCGGRASQRLHAGTFAMNLCPECRKRIVDSMKKDHGWQQVEGVLFVPEDDKANPPQATMTMYGSAVGIEYVAVAIHRGSDLIAGVFIDVEDCQTEEQMTNYLVAFTKKYNVDKMFILEQVLAPEYDQYGHRLLRIADGKGTLLPGSYSVIDTN